MTGLLSPYPGLRPFDVDESYLFFGREEQTDELLRRLRDTRFLAVVGPSGCGKSSLVRAGMIAALQSGFMVTAGSRWRFAIMRPGGHPMRRLATALVEQGGLGDDDTDRAAATGVLGATLRRGPLGLIEALRETPLPEATNLLVLVDQFEEIFRFRRENDSGEADAFVALLLAAARQRDLPIYVVITMRSDFFGDCANFTGLPEALNRSQYLTPRLSRDQRRAAIAGPARVFEGNVAPDLLNRLLNDMGTDPDQLPLMQHLLMRMWTWQSQQSGETPPPDPAADANETEAFAFHGAGRTLTLADHDAVGGLRHALSNHADEAFNRLDAERKHIAETLFRRLSERGPDGRYIRRPTRVDEIAEVAGATLAEVIEVVDLFRAPACSFVTPAFPERIDAERLLDITHEALIRQWVRLRDWTADEAQLAETYQFLEQNAQLWKQGRMALWSTPNLEMALDWRDRAQPTAIWAKRYGGDFGLAMQFLDASAAARTAKEAELRTQRRRQVRRLRLITAASVAIALFSAGTLGGAWWMFAHEHISYYRDFETRWDEPVGVGELSSEQVRHRAVSLRFVRKGLRWSLWQKTGHWFPTIRIEAVDANGNCTADNNLGTPLNVESDYFPLHECRIEFVWAADSDEIVYEKAYAKDGSLRRGYNYLTLANDAGRRIGYILGANGFFDKIPNSLAETVTFTYAPDGHETSRTFADHEGHRQPGIDHAYGQTRTYDAHDRLVEMTSLDKSDHPMNDTAGNATMRLEYDDAGNLIRDWALDKDGHPALWKNGYHRVEYTHDAYGRQVSAAYFDVTGRPTLNDNGVHEVRTAYDEHGNQREVAYFDRSGHPIVSHDGYHRAVASAVGPDGRWSHVAYFGTGGEKTTNTSGMHEYITTYDSKGFRTSMRSFDEQGRPVRALQGCHDRREDYDAEGVKVSQACFGSDGLPALFDEGYHRVTYAHDERGNVTEWADFGRDGQPVVARSGFHRQTSAYDALGNKVETAFFGAAGEPVRMDGYHRRVILRDLRGNALIISYLDERGNLVPGPDDYAKLETSYDGRDNAIEIAYYGDDGRLTQRSKAAPGYAVLRQTFDDHDRVIEYAYLDRDRKPVTGPAGFAIGRKRYDGDTIEERYYDTADRPVALPCLVLRQTTEERGGKPVELTCLDAQGHPALTADGFAVRQMRYDDHGNLIETVYRDADGRLLLHDGYAIARATFDASGNRIERSYYGTDGHLLLQADGFAVERRQFDERGNVTEWTYFGTDDQPVVRKDGYHRATARYDTRSNRIEEAYYGTDGKLLMQPEGYFISRSKYDDRSKLIERAFFGANGEPMIARDGYHRMAASYDEHGNRTEAAYYGTNGELLLQPDGFAIERRSYDDRGRTIEWTYLGEAGQPVALPDGYHRTTARYDEYGRKTERAFYGEDGALTLQSEGLAFERVSRDARGDVVESRAYGTDGALLARCIPTLDSGSMPGGCTDADGRTVHTHPMIHRIFPATPAERMGLRAGDILLSYAGKELFQRADLTQAIAQGGTDKRTLVIRRDGQTLSFSVDPGRLGVQVWAHFTADAPPDADQADREAAAPTH